MSGEAREAVIGLEVHVQLRTARKLFCGDAVEFGAEPNTRVCPVCLGLPGALPVVNREAAELGVRAALGLGCDIHERSVFARKNYFYPDLPKGYQITQFEAPLATGGRVEFVADADGGSGGDDAGDGGADDVRAVRIRRLHLEEDAGKSLHDRVAGATAVDLNRAGVPLAEIVTEPDLRSPEETRAFLRELKRLLEYLDVSDCNMEEGSLRVDANVSLRRPGEDLGTKTEVKNMNSFSGVERALAAEIERQGRLLDSGGDVVQETLLWDEVREEVRPMRTKEESRDYRYFPDPDLPPLELSRGRIDEIRDGLPELPLERRRRFRREYGLPAYDADVLTASRGLAELYETVARAVGAPKEASNWVMGPVLALSKDRGIDPGAFPRDPVDVAAVIDLVDDGTISRNVGKDLLERMLDDDRGPREIVEAEGLAQVRDEGRLEGWVVEALEENPDEAARLRDGEERLVGFFIGQVMRRSGGTADPHRVRELLGERLRER